MFGRCYAIPSAAIAAAAAAAGGTLLEFKPKPFHALPRGFLVDRRSHSSDHVGGAGAACIESAARVVSQWTSFRLEMEHAGGVNQQRATKVVFSLAARWLHARRPGYGTQRQGRASHHEPATARAAVGAARACVDHVELLTPLGEQLLGALDAGRALAAEPA